MTQEEEIEAIELFSQMIFGIHQSQTWARLHKRPEYEQVFIKLLEAQMWLQRVNVQYLPLNETKIEFSI
jgi:hypothetical protein